MKLESEADNSLCLFISAERGDGAAGVGCFASGEERPPFAQVPRPSIGRDTDGDGKSRGCGAQFLSAAPTKQPNGLHADDCRKILAAPEALGFSSLNCEHFRFIDEEDADELEPSATSNGVSSHQQNGGAKDVPNGKNEETRHLLEDHTEQVEVSDCVGTLEQQMSSVLSVNMCDPSKPNGVAPKELKGVLKKGKRSERKSKKARVTFDEAVTLYSDEFDEVQLLALRSAAEVNCAEVFYMFEPPIEYQDMLQPFEPPAEYRDTIENEICQCSVPPIDFDLGRCADQNGTCNDVQEIPVVEIEEVTEEKQNGDGEQSIDSRNLLPTDGEVIEAEDKRESEPLSQEQLLPTVDPTEESEKLFKRFLEAEREFDEDEELNRVFHVLESDLANDEKNGTFDDNFFKKLINLLSAVEGDAPVPEGDFFTTTDFTINEEDLNKDIEDDDQTHSRTLSEADSDCSVSSQDTIIVRLGEDESDFSKPKLCRQNSENETAPQNEKGICADKMLECRTPEIFDEVFGEESISQTNVNNADDSHTKPLSIKIAPTKPEQSSNTSGDLSRQSSGEQPSKDTVQDADDSTSSDSRSGEVEEDIKLDDIGYDEEDADDYDEECLRGMVRGNSKIRRIIKKNALQCTLFRGIEARRRQQPGSKFFRPKSPPLSQESLVEQLKWLTTVEDKEVDNFAGSKPPDVILSTGSVPLNGSIPSSEDEFNSGSYHHSPHYPHHMIAQDGQGVSYHIQGSYPIPQGLRPSRPWISPANHAQVPQQFQRPVYPAPRAIVRPMLSQMSYSDERMAAISPVPRDYRDWRVIQRVSMNREDHKYGPPADFKRCPNGPINVYRRVLPGQNHDELEQFVQQGSQRIERIRKRYSVAEEDDDPTFGFARRPSVRGVQNRLPVSGPQYLPSEKPPDIGTKYMPTYISVECAGQGPAAVMMRARNPPEMAWTPNPNWRQGESSPAYCTSTLGASRSTAPISVHRASVALAEHSGCATLPHPKSHSDTRYHSYAENMYSGSQTLPHKRWNSMDPRTCIMPGGGQIPRQLVPHQLPRIQGPAIVQPTLQVPQHPQAGMTSDERGVPEGASSSPKVSSDSLYHGPLQEGVPVGTTHNDDGVIYYSMNV